MKTIKSKLLPAARRALAVFSSAALLFCSLPAMTSASGETAGPASSAFEFASGIVIHNDTLDTDITEDPNIYLDNSDLGDGKMSQTVTISLTDKHGDPMQFGDLLLYEVGASNNSIDVENITPRGQKTSLTLRINAFTEENGETEPLAPGTVAIAFTNIARSVSLELRVTVFNPASDMLVYWNGSDTPLPLNDFSPDNSADVEAIANHSYLLSADVLPDYATDRVVWGVYDGIYTGEAGTSPTPTDKATINSDGVFNAIDGGYVTIVAKFAATPSSPRISSYGEKTLYKNGESGETVTERVKTVPKYIHVKITKQNPAEAITFTDAPDVLEVSDTYLLKYEIQSAYDGEVTDRLRWSSSDPTVISVSDDGTVEALKLGSATITLYAENQNVYAEKLIRVIKRASGITITPSPASTRVSVPIELTAQLNPGDSTDEIEWSVSDETIAEITSGTQIEASRHTAILTGLAEGTVTVTAKAVHSDVSAACEVTVSPKVETDSLSLSYAIGETQGQVVNGASIELYTKQTIEVTPKLTTDGEGAPDDSVEWTIDNNSEDFVSVLSKTGYSLRLIGSSEGTVTVTASSKSNSSIKKTFNLRVLRACDTVTLKDASGAAFPTKKSVLIGGLTTIFPDLRIDGNYPYQHSDRIVSWVSNAPETATVDENGSVRAINNGDAIITATTASGKTASARIYVFTASQVIMGNVSPSADGALPTAAVIFNTKGEGSIGLTVTVKDQFGNAVENADCTWSSSNESIAEVDNSGKVSAVKLGGATITVECGSKADQCALTVFSSIKNAVMANIGPQVFSPIRTTYEPKPILHYDSYSLIEGLDYSLSYDNNGGVGNATMTITGMRYFTGTRSVSFAIQSKPLTDSEVEMTEFTDQICTGSPIEQVPEITCSGVRLTPDVDFTINYTSNTYPGTATAVVKGKGNYSDSVTKTFEITCEHEGTTEPVIERTPTCSQPGLSYIQCRICGRRIETELPTTPHSFVDKVVPPTANSEGYTLHTCTVCGYSYRDNELDKTPGVPITECTAILSGSTFAYTGKPITPSVSLRFTALTLTEGQDYAIGYVNNTEVGTAYVIITGMGNYTGTGKVPFTIAEEVPDTDPDTDSSQGVVITDDSSEDDGRISLTQDEVKTLTARIYNPADAPFEPKPVVSAGGVALVENVDFVMTYANNENVGTASANMVGIGKYKGAARFTFEILPLSLTDSSVSVRSIEKQKCTGKEITPIPIVICDGVILANRRDYKLTYSSNVEPGVATMMITGIGNYTDSLSVSFMIECDHNYQDQVVPPTHAAQGYTLHTCTICGASYKDNYTSQLRTTDLSQCTIDLDYTATVYTGKPCEPGAAVKDAAGKLLTPGTDYTITYSNNTEVGVASATVTGKGAYTGYVMREFRIMRGIIGDVNSDGVITADDSLLVLRHTVGLLTLSETQIPLADVNHDGSISSDDSLAILRYSVGLPTPGTDLPTNEATV